MAQSPAEIEVLNFRYRERMVILLVATQERRVLLRMAGIVFVVLGIIGAGFLWPTAPRYALAATVPVVGCLACNLGLGVVTRRLRAGVPDMWLTHLDYQPLRQVSDELILYPLLFAGGIAAGVGVNYGLAFH